MFKANVVSSGTGIATIRCLCMSVREKCPFQWVVGWVRMLIEATCKYIRGFNVSKQGREDVLFALLATVVVYLSYTILSFLVDLWFKAVSIIMASNEVMNPAINCESGRLGSFGFQPSSWL